MKSLISFLVIFSTQVLYSNENWPEYRGPTADGHSDSTGLPLTWSETQNVKWKTAIHGRAWSSPVVWGKQVWFTTATPKGHDLSAICINRNSGKILKDLKLFHIEKPQYAHPVNTYGSPSPVIEEGRVYVSFGSPGTACIDTKTFEVIWKREDLKCNHFRGAGSSPVIHGDLLILTMDGSDFQYVIALNKKSGKTVWKQDRSTAYNDLVNGKPRANGDFRKGYSTPYIVKFNGRVQMISPGAKAAWSYDPADGSELWQVRYRNHSNASRTLFGQGLLFINTGYSKATLLAVRPDGKGDVTKSHVAWKLIQGVPNKPSPLLIGEHLYMVSDRGGIVSCVEAKTGKVLWQNRAGGSYSASMVYADGRIYLFSEQGKTTVITPGNSYKVLATNQLEGGFMASPAVAGRAFFLRTKSHLYRIEK